MSFIHRWHEAGKDLDWTTEDRGLAEFRHIDGSQMPTSEVTEVEAKLTDLVSKSYFHNTHLVLNAAQGPNTNDSYTSLANMGRVVRGRFIFHVEGWYPIVRFFNKPFCKTFATLMTGLDRELACDMIAELALKNPDKMNWPWSFKRFAVMLGHFMNDQTEYAEMVHLLDRDLFDTSEPCLFCLGYKDLQPIGESGFWVRQTPVPMSDIGVVVPAQVLVFHDDHSHRFTPLESLNVHEMAFPRYCLKSELIHLVVHHYSAPNEHDHVRVIVNLDAEGLQHFLVDSCLTQLWRVLDIIRQNKGCVNTLSLSAIRRIEWIFCSKPLPPQHAKYLMLLDYIACWGTLPVKTYNRYADKCAERIPIRGHLLNDLEQILAETVAEMKLRPYPERFSLYDLLWLVDWPDKIMLNVTEFVGSVGLTGSIDIL